MITSPIGVVLADDQALVREMLATRLAAEPDIEVVAAVGDAALVLAAVDQYRPRIVLLDIDMPGLPPFDAAILVRKRHPETSVLFLSGFVNDRYIARALEVEAAGFVSKAEPPDAVVRAVRKVAGGGHYFSPDVQGRIVVDRQGLRLGRARGTRIDLLTQRELEMLTYLARGYSRKEMARLAGISVKTVEQHCGHVSDKLDIHDRVELARFAIREGLVQP